MYELVKWIGSQPIQQSLTDNHLYRTNHVFSYTREYVPSLGGNFYDIPQLLICIFCVDLSKLFLCI